MNFEKPSFISTHSRPLLHWYRQEIKYGVDCVNIGSTNLTTLAEVFAPRVADYLSLATVADFQMYGVADIVHFGVGLFDLWNRFIQFNIIIQFMESAKQSFCIRFINIKS